ncbi:MAG: AAA family ATPase [Gemmatimonadaceae bacterium]|nr:AAA family ATPase [Gemmatimonadaceae bacterium]
MQPDATHDPTMAAALALVAQNDAIRAAGEPEALRTLSEWLADPASLEPPVPLIPRLVLTGRVTLLAARETAGKSTLLGQAVATFSRGGDFLGEWCGPGRVLWYASDEAPADAVRRLASYGADGDAVAIMSEKPTPEHVRAHIAVFGPSLVIVDTLTELLDGRLKDANDAMALTAALGPFMRVFRDTNTAAVLVHHATKDGRDYRGSGQIGAKVDVIAMLRIPGANAEQDEDPDVDLELETRRTLDVKGRGLIGRDRLYFDGEQYRLGEGEQGLAARIVRAVAEGATSKNKVAGIVKGRRETVMSAIHRLVEEGKLIKEGDALSAPFFGSGSASGSAHHKTQASGTTSGTTLSYVGATTRTAREPLGNHRELPQPVSGTSHETTRAKVVPDSAPLAPPNGNHPARGAGKGASPADEPLDDGYFDAMLADGLDD